MTTGLEDNNRVKTQSPRARRGSAAALLACLLASVGLLTASRAAGQNGDKPAQSKPEQKPAEKPGGKQGDAKPGELRPGATQSEIDAALTERLRQISSKKPSEWTAEELAERVAISYRGFNFSQLKKVYNTGREEGRITITTTNGELAGDYVRRYVNGPKMSQDRVRLDIIFETSPKPEQQLRYTLSYNGASVWAAQDNRYVTPDAAAGTAFKASVVDDYTALFRWQDDGGTLARQGTKRIQGLDLDVIEETRPDGSKLRFYISEKSFRILHIEYDVVLAEGQAPVTFRESYSEWRVIQEVLVAARRKLRQNDTLVQTIDLANATYGVALDDTVFLQL